MVTLDKIATISDAEELARLQIYAWQVAYRNILPKEYLDGLSLESKIKSWRNVLGNPALQTYVAIKDKIIVGFVRCDAKTGPQDTSLTCELHAIYVHPDFWGKGVGKGLMLGVIDRSRQASYKELFLWVFKNNAQARRFYENYGFKYANDSKQKEFAGIPFEQVKYELTI